MVFFEEFFQQTSIEDLKEKTWEEYISYSDMQYSLAFYDMPHVSNDVFMKILKVNDFYLHKKKVDSWINYLQKMKKTDAYLIRHIMSYQVKSIYDKKEFMKIFKYLDKYDEFHGFFSLISVVENSFNPFHVISDKFYNNQNNYQKLAIQFLELMNAENLNLDKKYSKVYMDRFFDALENVELSEGHLYEKHFKKMFTSFIEYQIKKYNEHKDVARIEKIIEFISQPSWIAFISQIKNNRVFWEQILNDFEGISDKEYHHDLFSLHQHVFPLIQVIHQKYEAHPKYNFLLPEELNYQFETFYYTHYSQYSLQNKQLYDDFIQSGKTQHGQKINDFVWNQLNNIPDHFTLKLFLLLNDDLQSMYILYKPETLMDIIMNVHENIQDDLDFLIDKECKIIKHLYEIIKDKSLIDFQGKYQKVNVLAALAQEKFEINEKIYNIHSLNESELLADHVMQFFKSLERRLRMHHIKNDFFSYNMAYYIEKMFSKLDKQEQRKMEGWLWEKSNHQKIWSPLIATSLIDVDNHQKKVKKI